jgi:hypothetical protein
VRLHDPTPRGLKRFCNRARLFAIHERTDGTVVNLDEMHVVALTALHHVDPRWLDWVGRSTAHGGKAELLKQIDARADAPDVTGPTPSCCASSSSTSARSASPTW